MIDDGMGFQLVPWRPALERVGSAGVRYADPWRGEDRLELPAQVGNPACNCWVWVLMLIGAIGR